MSAQRYFPHRFSIGDDNKVSLVIVNNYLFPVKVSVIDEIPAQFQDRKWLRRAFVQQKQAQEIEYNLKPLSRGVYEFHDINVYAQGPMQLVKRRYIFPARRC